LCSSFTNRKKNSCKKSLRLVSSSSSAAYSWQLLVQIDDLQLFVLVHPSYVYIHIWRELGFLRAIWTLISWFFATLKLAVRLHVGESGITAVASGTVKFLSRDRTLRNHIIRPARRSYRCYGGFLTMTRVDVKIRVLLCILHRVQIVSSWLIRLRGHTVTGHYLGMHVRRVYLPIKRI